MGVGKWYNMKVMVSKKDKTMYGKIWVEGKDEPRDWITKTTLTSYLEEDGVGLCNYQQVTFFDDPIVADGEDSLVMAVSSREKSATTWAKIKAAQ